VGGGGVGKGVGEGGEMTQTLYAHMNKRKKMAIVVTRSIVVAQQC
jgi:hypothetical protein